MSERLLKRVLIISGAACLLCFVLTPLLWMLWVSLASDPSFLVTGRMHLSFDNYIRLLGDRRLHFMDYFRNSLVVALVVSVVTTVISSMGGYAVSRLRFRGRIMVPLGILAMSMFPQIAVVGYLYRFFSGLGLLNSYAALILPYIAFTVPLAVWINLSYFAQIPTVLDEAASVDGAGRMQTLLWIIIPVALPGVFASFLLVMIQCFNEFMFALMLTMDHRAQTLPVGIALFEGTHGEIPWGSVMAASTLATLPLVALALVCQKHIVAGLTSGAVKG